MTRRYGWTDQDGTELLSFGVRRGPGTDWHPVVERKRDLTWLWCVLCGVAIGLLYAFVGAWAIARMP